MNSIDDELSLLHLLPILQRIIELTDTHKKFGITKSHIIIFIILHYRESMTMSEIAQYLSSSKEQATRTVAVLCDRNLVERYEDPGNRTHVYIRFTDEGMKFMRNLVEQLNDAISEKLSASLTDDDIQALNKSLKSVIDILNKVK